jgi:carotenoid cleavage dioxygenase-like enzyme
VVVCIGTNGQVLSIGMAAKFTATQQTTTKTYTTPSYTNLVCKFSAMLALWQILQQYRVVHKTFNTLTTPLVFYACCSLGKCGENIF